MLVIGCLEKGVPHHQGMLEAVFRLYRIQKVFSVQAAIALEGCVHHGQGDDVSLDYIPQYRFHGRFHPPAGRAEKVRIDSHLDRSRTINRKRLFFPLSITIY